MSIMELKIQSIMQEDLADRAIKVHGAKMSDEVIKSAEVGRLRTVETDIVPPRLIQMSALGCRSAEDTLAVFAPLVACGIPAMLSEIVIRAEAAVADDAVEAAAGVRDERCQVRTMIRSGLAVAFQSRNGIKVHVADSTRVNLNLRLHERGDCWKCIGKRLSQRQGMNLREGIERQLLILHLVDETRDTRSATKERRAGKEEGKKKRKRKESERFYRRTDNNNNSNNLFAELATTLARLVTRLANN